MWNICAGVEGTQTWNEGCLSFPGVSEEIKRAERVKVKALDRNGKPFEVDLAQGPRKVESRQIVKLPFTLEPEGGATRAKGELTTVRTDYGVGQGSWSSGDTVALDVIIRFDILARRIS